MPGWGHRYTYVGRIMERLGDQVKPRPPRKLVRCTNKSAKFKRLNAMMLLTKSHDQPGQELNVMIMNHPERKTLNVSCWWQKLTGTPKEQATLKGTVEMPLSSLKSKSGIAMRHKKADLSHTCQILRNNISFSRKQRLSFLQPWCESAVRNNEVYAHFRWCMATPTHDDQQYAWQFFIIGS